MRSCIAATSERPNSTDLVTCRNRTPTLATSSRAPRPCGASTTRLRHDSGDPLVQSMDRLLQKTRSRPICSWWPAVECGIRD